MGSISRYDGSCKLYVWLCQIAKHVLYQELRKNKRVETVELSDYLPDDFAPNGETSVLNQENRIELYRAIHHLMELEDEIYDQISGLDRNKDALSYIGGIKSVNGVDGICYSVHSVIGENATFWTFNDYL